MSYRLPSPDRDQMIKLVNSNSHAFQLSSSPKDSIHQLGKVCTLFGDGLTDAQLLELILYRNFRSIVQNSFQPAPEKLETMKRISVDPGKFLDLDFQLLEIGSATKDFPFTQQTNRDSVIREICEFALLKPESARATKALQTLEELLMNAQVNAPALRPTNDKMLSYIKIEYTDRLLAISAFDCYGSLDCKKFLKKIEAGMALGLGKSMNLGKGGAGLGSSLIFQNCDSLFLGVTPNRKTRVSVIMPYNVTERKYEGLQRSIHVLEIK
ncbi:MAG: hypothetical protein A2622_13320 [Bdellovibrionales bacterium RIFCSPHIGHO2_01_FULL_40_29]|nr:MAG: hypothetical protein A2622_13320 [Bdellovibrionales bacterium RIFCSPHIGHO2_01_FULL_40_29]OFZ33332.1 MAG: hypothetical protein A3D17_13565 [Bdellovibrionales bacterium RIFCSPHIGHO2_02_FULL_40_15]